MHLLKLQGRKQVGRTQVDDGSSAFGSLNAFTIIVYYICFLNIIDRMNRCRTKRGLGLSFPPCLCLSMPIIANQCQSALIGIDRHWDQCQNFDRHWALIEGVLRNVVYQR